MINTTYQTSLNSMPCTLDSEYSNKGLFKACKNNDLICALQAIMTGAELESRDQWGRTPLHIACSNGYSSLVIDLIMYGADKDFQDNFGQTPLHLACLDGDLATVETLIFAGASTTIKNNDGLTPALIALEFPHLEHLFSLTVSDKTFLAYKRISHFFHIEGKLDYNGKTIIELEGSLPQAMLRFILESLEDFESLDEFENFQITKENFQVLKNAIRESFTHSYDEILKNIQNKELTFIQTGWETHTICLCFFGEYMAVCNRGEGTRKKEDTIKVFKIEPKKMILQTVKKFKMKNFRDGRKYFYEELPAELGPWGIQLQDSLCKEFETIGLSEQKSGNCSLASPKAAIRFAWAMLIENLEQAKKESKVFTDYAALRSFRKTANILPLEFLGLPQVTKIFKTKKTRFQNLSL